MSIEGDSDGLPQKIQSSDGSGSKKRKLAATSNSSADRSAKRKRKGKKAAAEADADLDVELGINHAIGRMDSRLIADYVAQKTKRFGSDLSVVELEDVHIPGMQSARMS